MRKILSLLLLSPVFFSASCDSSESGGAEGDSKETQPGTSSDSLPEGYQRADWDTDTMWYPRGEFKYDILTAEMDDPKAIGYGMGSTMGDQINSFIQQTGTDIDKDAAIKGFDEGARDVSNPRFSMTEIDSIRNSFFESKQNNLPVTVDSDALGYVIGYETANGYRKRLETAGGGNWMDYNEYSKGFSDKLNGRDSKYEDDRIKQALDTFNLRSSEVMIENNYRAGLAFLDSVSQLDGIQKTESGIYYRILQEGTGATPTESDVVGAAYRLMNVHGKVMQENQNPIEFPVNGVVPGWIETLQDMKVGEDRIIYLPMELGYGDRGSRDILPKSALVFRMRLEYIK